MSAPDGTQVEVSEKEIAAAKNEVAAAKAELAGAKERLVKAEDVLRKAQEVDPVDAQRVADQRVAEAKLGVAKAELGVAEAKWQAAPTASEKAVYQAILKTAQESVEAANMAYKMALTATATPQQEGSSAHSSRESGHESVSSDLEKAFENKAVMGMKVALWNMFQGRAFTCAPEDEDAEYACSREIAGEQFDFVSHLQVDRELSVLEHPSNMCSIVNGTWDEWLRGIKGELGGTGAHDRPSSGNQDLSPNKPSSTENATHYIVCESKVSTGKSSTQFRLLQLEKKVEFLLNRACDRHGTRCIESVVALAGIGVPKSGSLICATQINNWLNSNKGRCSNLQRLNKLHRVFVFFVETAGDRLEKLEVAQEQQRQTLERLERWLVQRQ